MIKKSRKRTYRNKIERERKKKKCSAQIKTQEKRWDKRDTGEEKNNNEERLK